MKEYNIEKQIKRENKIIRLHKNGLSFKEIANKINGLAERTVRSSYHAGLLRKKLKKKGINTDNLSSSVLAELGTINSLAIQIDLIKKLESGEIKNRTELRKFKKGLATSDDSDAIADNDHDILETQMVNDLKSEYKLITNYKDLAEKVMRLMNKNKLDKYSKKSQDFCIEIMKKLKEYLEEQLGLRRVIIVNQD